MLAQNCALTVLDIRIYFGPDIRKNTTGSDGRALPRSPAASRRTSASGHSISVRIAYGTTIGESDIRAEGTKALAGALLKNHTLHTLDLSTI